MTRIAFVNLGYYENMHGRRHFQEPTHLVPMHNICWKAGHQSVILQFRDADIGDLQFGPSRRLGPHHELQSFRPEVLGFSVMGHPSEAIKAGHEILRSLNPKPRLLIGGPNVIKTPQLFYEEFHQYYPSDHFSPLLIATEGESFMAALAANNFDLDRALASGPFRLTGIINGPMAVSQAPHLPLDQHDFSRPYSLVDFDGKAQVKASTGCWGKCGFCFNEARPLDFRSPESILREIQPLQADGVKSIGFTSPNFTALPRMATAILSALPPLENGYDFLSRVDSLYAAITLFPSEWKAFAQQRLIIELGVESFDPERLVFLGKYPNLKQAELQQRKFQHIIDFFSGTKARIRLDLIMLDYQMTLAGAEKEALVLRELLERHDSLFEVYPWIIGKTLFYSPGSELAEQLLRPDNFLDFRRDPRLLFLHLDMKQKQKALSELSWTLGDSLLIEGLMAKLLLEYYIFMIEQLRDINFQVEKPLELSWDDKSSDDATRKLLGRLGWWRGRALRRKLDSKFDEIAWKLRSPEYVYGHMAEGLARAITDPKMRKEMAEHIRAQGVDKGNLILKRLRQLLDQ